MRKDEYHFVVIYCKLQQNGYARCNGGYDCRKCNIPKESPKGEG